MQDMVGIDTQSHDTIEEQVLEGLRPIQARITYQRQLSIPILNNSPDDSGSMKKTDLPVQNKNQIVKVLNLRFISDIREQSPCSYLFPRIDIDRLKQDKDNGS